jgi:hypothetical protein
MAKVNWKSFAGADDVRKELENRLPKNSTVTDVRSFSAQQGWECSDIIDQIIYCSTPATSKWFFVKAKWLIQFHFENNKLTLISVNKGLTGP